MARKRRKVSPGSWERGYLSHHYWSKRWKIGSVFLVTTASGSLGYAWECPKAGAAGLESSLVLAKRCVEGVHASGWVQQRLSGLDEQHAESESEAKAHTGKGKAAGLDVPRRARRPAGLIAAGASPMPMEQPELF